MKIIDSDNIDNIIIEFDDDGNIKSIQEPSLKERLENELDNIHGVKSSSNNNNIQKIDPSDIVYDDEGNIIKIRTDPPKEKEKLSNTGIINANCNDCWRKDKCRIHIIIHTSENLECFLYKRKENK